jgi:hypothetical protein
MSEPSTGLSRVATLYWLLAVMQAAHSIEEMRTRLYDFFWVVTGLVHSVIPSFPQFRMSAETFAVINMTFIAVLLGAVPAVQARRPWALALAGVAAVVEILNGLSHTAAAIYFGGYVPGAASAPFLFVLGVFLLRELIRSGAGH